MYNLCEHYLLAKFMFYQTEISSLIFSYIGKGIIQASPQAVMDAVKNPRTRYTYDDSLKVDMCW